MKLFIVLFVIFVGTFSHADTNKKKRIDCSKLTPIELRSMEEPPNCIPEKKPKPLPDPYVGMSSKAALKSAWGEPDKVNTTITSSGRREQWVYRDGSYLYFTNGVLTAIQF